MFLTYVLHMFPRYVLCIFLTYVLAPLSSLGLAGTPETLQNK